jgi:putative DNA primase/helicase
MPDRELLIAMLSSPHGGRLRSIWRGDWESRYGSASEADLALAGSLLWWCQGDVEQADRLFRQSGLFRDKWTRSDYRERTFSQAMRGEGTCLKSKK